MPYSILFSYTDKSGSTVTESGNLVRKGVAMPLKAGGKTWLATADFNSSEALKGQGAPDENLDRIYVTITDLSLRTEAMVQGSTQVGHVKLFEGEFKLQPGKKTNVYKTPDYSIDVLVTHSAEGEKK